MYANTKLPEYIASRIYQQFWLSDPEGLITGVSPVSCDLQQAVSSLRITDRNGQSYRITIEKD